MPSNPFDEILGLEEQFYDEGYQQGVAEGTQAGRIEGRTFGLEKGFEKYVESGVLHGRSLVWANRVPQFKNKSLGAQSGPAPVPDPPSTTLLLPTLPDNPRLAKHVKVFHALAESDTLSTENSEEAVSDFDDRFKRAQAKAKIIERMVGEVKADANGQRMMVSSNDGSIEDVSVLKAR